MSTVASFSIEFRQCLDEDGNLVAEPVPALAKDYDQLAELYRTMTLARVFDRKVINLQRTGKLGGTYASCEGHEATHAAIGSAMRWEDCFVPMYREYAAQLLRKVKMSEIIQYWGGDERGNDFAEAPAHDFAWSVPIATQTLHATGAAFAFKYREEPRVAVTVVGDGGSSKGDFYEALNAAGVYDLPMVAVIVNNQYAISVPRAEQSHTETLAQKAIAAGIPGVQVDGNDLIAARTVMDEAIERARSGRGPMVVEAVTYRLSDHTTADDAKRYRSDDEVETAKRREPLPRLYRYLTAAGAWDDDKEQAWREECGKRVDAAVEEYANAPAQPVTAMFDYMYANMPPLLQRQRRLAIEEAERHG